MNISTSKSNTFPQTIVGNFVYDNAEKTKIRGFVNKVIDNTKLVKMITIPNTILPNNFSTIKDSQGNNYKIILSPYTNDTYDLLLYFPLSYFTTTPSETSEKNIKLLSGTSNQIKNIDKSNIKIFEQSLDKNVVDAGNNLWDLKSKVEIILSIVYVIYNIVIDELKDAIASDKLNEKLKLQLKQQRSNRYNVISFIQTNLLDELNKYIEMLNNLEQGKQNFDINKFVNVENITKLVDNFYKGLFTIEKDLVLNNDFQYLLLNQKFNHLKNNELNKAIASVIDNLIESGKLDINFFRDVFTLFLKAFNLKFETIPELVNLKINERIIKKVKFLLTFLYHNKLESNIKKPQAAPSVFEYGNFMQNYAQKDQKGISDTADYKKYITTYNEYENK